LAKTGLRSGFTGIDSAILGRQQTTAESQPFSHSRQSDEIAADLGPVGRKGAAAPLGRLESVEERAHVRFQRAIEAGNPFQVKAAQEFYLRCSETLRRLDLAVETERRNAEEQVPLRQIEAIAAQISTWLRVAFEQFLGSESPSLMAITDLGEFKFSAIESFRCILHGTVKSSIRINPPIPDWAAAQVIEAWNIY
jgi:hypothetical protein